MSCLLTCFPTKRIAALADGMSNSKLCLCSNISIKCALTVPPYLCPKTSRLTCDRIL